jgi:Co/Zn/Cd efflux system component
VDSLKFGSKVIENSITREIEKSSDKVDKKLLWTVLVINLSFFVIELIFGLIANSMGLIADSFDMAADAIVYGLSLYAITGTLIIKKKIAGISGIFQLLLASFGFIEVIRRLIGSESVPNSSLMIVISIFALIANSVCLILLNKSKNKEAHIRSSQIFTSNDVIANIGVIFAGILVIIFDSKIPDLIIGTLVFGLVLRGSIKILKLSK